MKKEDVFIQKCALVSLLWGKNLPKGFILSGTNNLLPAMRVADCGLQMPKMYVERKTRQLSGLEEGKAKALDLRTRKDFRTGAGGH